MPRNIEIKARIVGSVAAMFERARGIATSEPVEIQQEDTFFNCATGRLKLRRFSEADGVLIAYDRPDTTAPKESRYTLAQTSNPGALRDVLRQALGELGQVRTRRTLFLVGQTRIHLDHVEGLGDYVELEVVLKDEESAQQGIGIANRLMEQLGISPADLIDKAYVDLLAEGAVEDSTVAELTSIKPTSLWKHRMAKSLRKCDEIAAQMEASEKDRNS